MNKKVFNEVPEIVKVSSKGQLVIPQDIREERHIKEGSVFAISSPNDDILVLKRITNPMMKEDLELLKDVEEAWEEIEQGNYTKSSKEEFLKELDSW